MFSNRGFKSHPPYQGLLGRQVEARVPSREGSSGSRRQPPGRNKDAFEGRRVNRSARREGGDARINGEKPALDPLDISRGCGRHGGEAGELTCGDLVTSSVSEGRCRHGNGLSSRVRRKDQRDRRSELVTPEVTPDIRREPKLVADAVRGVRRARSSAEPWVTPRDPWPEVHGTAAASNARWTVRRGSARCGQPSDREAGGSHGEDRRFLRERPDAPW